MRSFAHAILLLVAILAIIAIPVSGKVFDHCDLFRQLKSMGASTSDATLWVCIANFESTYNTAAYADHGNNFITYGLFQILNQYWCSPPGNECNVACSSLLDDNISDDFHCANTIKSQNGWTAWSTYNSNCDNGRANQYVNGC